MRPRVPLPPPLAETSFTYDEGRRAGLGRHRLRGGDLQHPFQGVILPREVDTSLVTLCRALAKRLPDDAFYCGITAARLMGIPLPARTAHDQAMHVGVPAPSFPPSGRGIRGHVFQLVDDEIRSWGGLRTTGPERTWCELASLLSLTELIAAGDYLVHWRTPIATVDSLADAVKRRPRRRGIVRLREATGRLNDHSESPMESELRVLLEDAGLTGLVANYPIRTSGGFNYRADLAFPKRRLLIEYQSAFHETPEKFRADMTRISRLDADTYKVIQVNKDDMRQPIELVDRIRRIHDSRPFFD